MKNTQTSNDNHNNATDTKYVLAMSLAALGVVFGDIGTSPLYAVRECFFGVHSIPVTRENILGVLSLIFWSLILVISVKYLLLVLKADNRGEGGVLALMTLAHPKAQVGEKSLKRYLVYLGLFGAALLYGDGMITPAVSVLGAVEGLEIATPLFQPYILPITIAILCLLFSPQSFGTSKMGSAFGPIILVWFITIAVLGVGGIRQHWDVLLAANPYYAVEFFHHNGWHGFLILGTTVLVVTGGEALYADMGHFGRTPIRFGWFFVALPALLLNYFGQGALLLADPSAAINPFFKLSPDWFLYPLIVIATLAAVTACQALISGAYSITRQAIQFGYLPRQEIKHTSEDEIGQIYIPFINWSLLAATIVLVIYFGSSSNLAAAYGVAVTATMAITTILLFVVARERWQWKLWVTMLAIGVFLLIDLCLLSANILKIPAGGWLPIVIGGVLFTFMTTWRRGRAILANRLTERAVPLPKFIETLHKNQPYVAKGTAIFMTSTKEGTPPALLHNLKHNKVIHENTILMTVVTVEIPHVPRDERFVLKKIHDGLFTMVVRYGFMDSPNIPAVLSRCSEQGFSFKLADITYFLGRETVLATRRPGMAIWREKLFDFMSRNAQRATAFFRLPPDQVVELGMQVEF